jgi:hypothetical protein
LYDLNRPRIGLRIKLIIEVYSLGSLSCVNVLFS